MDFYAKQAILGETNGQDTTTKRFPLEPICVFLGRNKLTSDKGDRLCFWAHKQVTKESFYESKIMFEEFELVDWEMVYLALHKSQGCSKFGHANRSWTLPRQIGTGPGSALYVHFAQAVHRYPRHALTSCSAAMKAMWMLL
jgi:hypothetical protein